MKIRTSRLRVLLPVVMAALLFAATPHQFIAPSRAQEPSGVGPNVVPPIAPGSAYRLNTLISDIPGLAPVLDPLMVNPWGISMTASSPFWVANNGTSTTQLIRGDVSGAPVRLNASPQTVTIP